MPEFKSNENIILSLRLKDNNNNYYPSVIVESNDGTILNTFNLLSTGVNGRYKISLTVNDIPVGKYDLTYIIYQDNLRTIRSERYLEPSEKLIVTDIENFITNQITALSDRIDDNDGGIA